MKRALEITQLAVYVTLALLLGVSTLLVVRARKAIIDVEEQIVGIRQDFGQLRSHADRVLTEAGLTAKAAKDISEMEKAAFPVTQAKLNAAIDDFRALAHSTDVSLNDEVLGVLPEIARATEKNSLTLNNALLDFQIQSGAVLHQGALTLESINAQASNPDIPRSLANIAAMSESGAETLGHVNAGTADIQAAVHRWTKPAAWWKSALHEVAGGAAKVRVWF